MKTFLAIVGALTLLAGTALVGQRLYAGFDPYAFWDDPTLVPLYARAELGDRAAQYRLGMRYKALTNDDWMDNVNTEMCGLRSGYWLARAYWQRQPLAKQALDELTTTEYDERKDEPYSIKSKRCWPEWGKLF